MDTYVQVISKIIKEQQSLIGPIALDPAKRVQGLQVSSADDVRITGNGKDVLGGLVNEYAKIFGRASIEVCKEAFAPFRSKLPQEGIPEILKN